MSVARAFVHALALSAALPWVMGGGDALAGDEVLAAGVFAAAHAPPVVADGEPVTLVFVALDTEGRPLSGIGAKVVASAGVAEGWTEVAPGLYTTTWRASGLPTSSVTVTAKGRHPASKAALTATATLRVVAAGPALEARISPSSVTLGRDAEANLTLLGADARTLRVRASAGTVDEPTAQAGGATTVRWIAPTERPPRVAVLTFADANDPSRRGHVALPLSGSIDFPVTGEPGDQVSLELAGKRFGPVVLDADGKGRVPLIVPPGVVTATKLTLRDGSETRGPLDLKIRDAKRLALYPMPAAVAAGKTVSVRVVVVRPDGSPDPDAQPVLTASAGEIGPIAALGGGVFEADLVAPADGGTLTISATLGSEVQTEGMELLVTSEAARNPVAHVVLVPDRYVMASDAASTTEVAVVALDAGGLPVAGARVELATEGAALSTDVVTTGEDGFATVLLTSGASARLVGVTATSGVGGGSVSVVEVADPAALPMVVPPSGTALEVALAEAWRGVRTQADAAVVARVTLSVDGAFEPGATVTLVAAAVNQHGRTVAAAVPEITASAGTLSDPEVQPDGSVRRTLVLPAELSGTVALVATSGDRQAKVDLGGDPSADPWAPTPDPVLEPEPIAPEPVAVVAAPVEEEVADPRWLRIRGSVLGGTYRYEQAPSLDPGPLFPSRLAVGGDAGAPATPFGGELDARLWGDELGAPWVGAHGQVRTAAYTIESAAFEGPANDLLLSLQLDAMVRYPFAVGSDQYWVGAKGGLHANDFLYFEGCVEPGCDVTYSPKTVTGLGVGAEIGTEFDRLYLVCGYTLGLARATEPYSNAVDLDLGYEVVDQVFVDLGFTSLSRSVVLKGADSGLDRATLTDANMIFKLGLGFAR